MPKRKTQLRISLEDWFSDNKESVFIIEYNTKQEKNKALSMVYNCKSRKVIDYSDIKIDEMPFERKSDIRIGKIKIIR